MSGGSAPPVILVVDDEPGVRHFTCQLLAREGYRTLDACHGREALALLRAGPGEVALVLSDVRMPEMNGIQLERAIRDEWPDLPVVLMSGEVTREWIVRLEAGDRASLLRKPFQPEELLAAVCRQLGSRPGPETESGGLPG